MNFSISKINDSRDVIIQVIPIEKYQHVNVKNNEINY
jgi:hypothetical protein